MLMAAIFVLGLSYDVVGDFKRKYKRKDMLCVLQHQSYAFKLCFINCYSYLVYLSVSTCAVIGQFCGPYFTVRPANFKNFFSACPINLRDIINILLTSFSRSVL